MVIKMKEDERNEKIIHSLLKLPPNRKCINCNSLVSSRFPFYFIVFMWVIALTFHRVMTSLFPCVQLLVA